MSDKVSRIILQQLGGNKFLAMTGAKDLVYDKTSLTFKLPKNRGKIFAYKIKLDEATDTYEVTTFKRDGQYDFKQEKQEGIYCDMLRDIISKETGFALHL